MFTRSSSSPISVVTGGAGFLGSHLTDRLLERGEKGGERIVGHAGTLVGGAAAWRADARREKWKSPAAAIRKPRHSERSRSSAAHAPTFQRGHPERSSVGAKAGRNAVEGPRGMTSDVAGDSTGSLPPRLRPLGCLADSARLRCARLSASAPLRMTPFLVGSSRPKKSRPRVRSAHDDSRFEFLDAL